MIWRYSECHERMEVLDELKGRKEKDRVIALDFSGMTNRLRDREEKGKWGRRYQGDGTRRTLDTVLSYR